MLQIDDLVFNASLRYIQASFWTDADITILNNKVVKEFSLYNPLKNTVRVQRNKSKHIINRLQAKQIACHISHNLIIYLAHHTYNKKKWRRIYHLPQYH